MTPRDKRNKDKTPYTKKKPDEVYVDHEEEREGYKSPYVTQSEDVENPDEPFRSPYTTPQGEEVEDDEYKSPYVTPDKGDRSD
jgi:hypothetical protein